MGFSFFSINDPKGSKVADCFKVENTTYCDSPKTKEKLDVIKIESSQVDPYARSINYYARNLFVYWGLVKELRPRISRLYASTPERAYTFDTKIDSKRVEKSERFATELFGTSDAILNILSKIIVSDQTEWEVDESKGKGPVYEAEFLVVVNEGGKQARTRMKVNIELPKDKKIRADQFCVSIQFGKDQYLYQFQTLPAQIQKALKDQNLKTDEKDRKQDRKQDGDTI